MGFHQVDWTGPGTVVVVVVVVVAITLKEAIALKRETLATTFAVPGGNDGIVTESRKPPLLPVLIVPTETVPTMMEPLVLVGKFLPVTVVVDPRGPLVLLNQIEAEAAPAGETAMTVKLAIMSSRARMTGKSRAFCILLCFG